MSIKQLDLPSIYKEREDNPVPEKFKQFIGRPALSYSSYSSFIEDNYRGEFFGNKFLDMPRESTIFTSYGSSVGMYEETGLPQEFLSAFDMEVLNRENPANPLAEYEREIVIDRGSYIIYGFVDRLLDGVLQDFKTGAIDKKAKDYASEDYNQTVLYTHGLLQEGVEIKDVGVILFDRKGNSLKEGDKNVLRLTGDIEYIDTPYSVERAEKFLKKMDETALKIEEYYKTYKKYFS